MPFFGVCFGFQLLGMACGARVIHDSRNAEFGTTFITLTKEGMKDKIFHSLPRKFLVQQAHEWRISGVRPDIEVLAIGDKVKYQAIKLKSAPIYGVQCHPELDKKDMAYRMRLYNKEGKSYYFPPEVINKLKHSPLAKRIIINFVRNA